MLSRNRRSNQAIEEENLAPLCFLIKEKIAFRRGGPAGHFSTKISLPFLFLSFSFPVSIHFFQLFSFLCGLIPTGFY